MLWRCLLSGLLVVSAVDIASADDGAASVDQAGPAGIDGGDIAPAGAAHGEQIRLASVGKGEGDDGHEPARMCAYLYDSREHRGMHLSVSEGSRAYLGGFWNDRASSIELEPGCEIWVYEHAWYGGAWGYFNTDVTWLGPWNNIISAYRCYCAY